MINSLPLYAHITLIDSNLLKDFLNFLENSIWYFTLIFFSFRIIVWFKIFYRICYWWKWASVYLSGSSMIIITESSNFLTYAFEYMATGSINITPSFIFIFKLKNSLKLEWYLLYHISNFWKLFQVNLVALRVPEAHPRPYS